MNNIDETGTKNVGCENPKILQNVKDCKDGSDPEYSGSSFRNGFLAGFEKEDLMAAGDHFTPLPIVARNSRCVLTLTLPRGRK